MLKNLKKYWYLTLFLVVSLMSYISVLIPPTVFWPAVFTSYAIPGIISLNLLLLLLLLIIRWRLALFPFLGLVSGFIFVQVTFSKNGQAAMNGHGLSIMSYNTRFFRTSNTYRNFSTELIDWVASDTSDVKCIQEYCANSNFSELDVSGKVEAKGYNSFIFVARGRESDHDQGLALFSKLPIVNRGYVWQSHGSINAGMYADLNFDGDTIRIYNIHLESMGIILRDYKERYNYSSKLKALIKKLKYGAEVRSDQINKLVAHTINCPYPYIICGDFNETPYSYNYFNLRSIYQNTFEEVGDGFGFSFNSLLFFLRIDHHFHGESVIPIHFKVDRSMKISDHFPTRGLYHF